jgi:hypothetical protein
MNEIAQIDENIEGADKAYPGTLTEKGIRHHRQSKGNLSVENDSGLYILSVLHAMSHF